MTQSPNSVCAGPPRQKRCWLAGALVWVTAASTVVSGVHYAVLTSRKLARHTGGAPPAHP
jgi:hypothetical protein